MMLRAFFCLLLACLVITDSFGQTRYKVNRYTAREGLPQNSVRGLTFGQHGFLWIATEGGLARFDGCSFKLFGTDEYPELEGQRFTRATLVNDTCMLFSIRYFQHYLLKGNKFIEVFSGDNQPPPLSPRLIASEKDLFICVEKHQLWPYWDNGLYRINNRYTLVKLYLNNEQFLVDHQTGQYKPVRNATRPDDFLISMNNKCYAIDIKNNKLSLLDLSTCTFMPVKVLDENRKPYHLIGQFRFLPDYSSKRLFFYKDRALFTLDEAGASSTFVLRKIPIEIPVNCQVLSVTYRPENELYALGTATKGLLLYQKQHFTPIRISSTSGIMKNAQYAQALLDENTLLTSYGDLIDISSERAVGMFPYPFVSLHLYTDIDNRLFFNSKHNLMVMDLNQTTKKAKILARGREVRSAIRLNEGLLASTTGGMYFIRDDTLEPFLIRNFKGDLTITNIYLDWEERLWFSNFQNLYTYDFKTTQLDSFPELEGKYLRTLECINGKIFIGTYGHGYYIYHEGQIKKMPMGSNNEFAHVHAFIEDSKRHLWITTNRGLYRTHIEAIDAYLDGRANDVYYTAYLEEDGIGNSEFNGGCIPNHIWLPNNKLSLPSMDGLVQFDPLEVPEFFPRDPIIMESLREGDSLHAPTGSIYLPAGHAPVDIRFATAWWQQPYNLKLEYKLEGLEKKFQTLPTGQQLVRYRQLKPGNYTFIVRKRVGYMPEDYATGRLAFTVLPPWYLKPWAFVLYLLAFLMVLWGTSYLYASSIKRRNRELQKRVDIQTTELSNTNRQLEENLNKLEHSRQLLRKNVAVKDRLISILSHDILTPLKFIGLIAKTASVQSEESPELRALRDVQTATGKLFHYTQNILNWVKYQQDHFKPEKTKCAPYALVDQLFYDLSELGDFRGNELLNEVPEDDVIRTDPNLLSIILHNLVSNAIKFTENGTIRISATAQDGEYTIKVSDTGRGMSEEQLQKVQNGLFSFFPGRPEDPVVGNSVGLALVDELVGLLDARWTIENRPAGGLVVTIFLPLE